MGGARTLLKLGAKATIGGVLGHLHLDKHFLFLRVRLICGPTPSLRFLKLLIG